MYRNFDLDIFVQGVQENLKLKIHVPENYVCHFVVSTDAYPQCLLMLTFMLIFWSSVSDPDPFHFRLPDPALSKTSQVIEEK